MKLQKQFARELKGKEYSKWVVVIPPEDVVELGWKEGDELQSKIFKDGLLLLPMKKEYK